MFDLYIHFLAKAICIALLGVIWNPWSELLASVAWESASNSTKEMSLLPGTKRTSLKPGNLHK